MHLKIDLLRTYGFTQAEIQTIQEYSDRADRAGRFSRRPAFVLLGGETQLVCWTIAEVLDQLRPGCWLNKFMRFKADGPAWETKEEYAQGLIKVHFTLGRPGGGSPGGEYLCARPLSRSTARIDSIPFATGRLARGDLVRFDRDREITQILEHVAKTRLLRYADLDQQPVEAITTRYMEVQAKLQEHDIDTEAMFPGVCSISVSRHMDDAELESVAAGLKSTIIVHDDEPR